MERSRRRAQFDYNRAVHGLAIFDWVILYILFAYMVTALQHHRDYIEDQANCIDNNVQNPNFEVNPLKAPLLISDIICLKLLMYTTVPVRREVHMTSRVSWSLQRSAFPGQSQEQHMKASP